MNELFKEYIRPIILFVCTSLLDVVLRNASIEKLKFLTKPLISINFIEIFILGFLIFYLSRFIPSEYKKRRNKSRAARLQANWIKFKSILEEYLVRQKDSPREYQDLRNRIREDFNYFLTDITEVLRKTGYGQQSITLNNFQQCFEPTDLKEWFAKVKRQVPKELECFDYILAALVRHFDK